MPLITPSLTERLHRPLSHCAFAILLAATSGFAQANADIRQWFESWQSGHPAIIANETIANPRLLQSFYEQRQYQPAWALADGIPPAAKALLDVIADTPSEGLLPQDYHFNRLNELLHNSLHSQAADVLLSDAFITLAGHLLAGKVEPEKLTAEWKAAPRHGDPALLLKQTLEKGDVAAALNRQRPTQMRYQRLKSAWTSLQSKPVATWPTLGNGVIKPGASDTRLSEIAQRLQYWGDLAGPHKAEHYDSELQAAIHRFQQRHGLDSDGIIGAETLRALNVSPQQRQQEILVNMERWRWLPADLGARYVLVNIAGFELKVIDGVNTVFRTPVVVGRDFRKTPVFSDRIRYLVLNPTWTVPHRLAVEDKLPELQRDPGYLKKYGFKVMQQGEAIDASGINWTKLSRNRFPYTLVQSPGPLNALGQIKFMFPNSWDVYLHDTPSRELFKKSERAFSSGCIRVADPVALATWLLSPQGWDRPRIETALKNADTQTVHLKTPVPVHIEYWTAWVEADGQWHFRKDIYQRDAAVLAALQKPLSKVSIHP